MFSPVSKPQKVLERLPHQGSALQAGGYSDTAWFSKLNGRALIVCHIHLGDKEGGTGFLIGKDLIMTNNHVLDSLEAARTAKAYFFHKTDSQTVVVELNPDDFFYTSPTPDQLGFEPIIKDKLDFTIVSIKYNSKIAEISHLAFSIFNFPKPKTESNANIIHHPFESDGTTYQKISFRENLIKELTLYTIH